MAIHAQIIEKDGRKEFAVLPYEEFLAMQEALEDYQDLMELRDAKSAACVEESLPLETVRQDLLKD